MPKQITEPSAERRLAARIGGLSLAAQRDPKVYTMPARTAFLSRFLDEQPHNLPESERVRRAEASRRVYFTQLALKSLKARRRKGKGAG